MINHDGNIILQQAIKIFDFNEITIIYNEVLKKIKYLINNKNGSRILEILLYKCNEEQAKPIIEEIFKVYENKFISLCLDKDSSNKNYSNYIIKVIIKKDKKYIHNIYKEIKGNFYMLSKDISASTIVEALLEYGSDKERDEIGKEIITNDNILNLIDNQYGNYVIQLIIEYCSENIKKTIIKTINEIPDNERKKYKFLKYVEKKANMFWKIDILNNN